MKKYLKPETVVEEMENEPLMLETSEIGFGNGGGDANGMRNPFGNPFENPFKYPFGF